MRIVAAAILLVVAFAGPALAERRVALVMGTDDYRLVRPLENAVNDARAIEMTLEKLGFEVFVETDRDLKRMRRALEDFREDAAGADVALVFFAGHGVEIAGENRLLPADADASSLDALKWSTLPLEEITETVRTIAPVAIVLLDACRDDPFGMTADGRGATADGRGAVPLVSPALPDTVKPGLGRVGRAGNVLFAFAAAPGMTASDGTEGNSPFTAALARYLGTDGVQVGSALKLVQQDVYDRTRRAQLPFIEDGLPAIFFAAKQGDLPERERLLLAMADLSFDMRDQVERIAAGRDMPLAPLYAALIGSDLGTLTVEDRGKKLEEAAQAYADTQEKLRALSASDEVKQLRVDAEKALALGALGEADAYLDRAIAADERARQASGVLFINNTLSKAASLFAKAGVARTALDHTAAIAALEEAAALHAQIEALDVPDAARRDRDWLLAYIGDLHMLVGNTTDAEEAYRRMRAAAEARLTRTPNKAEAERDISVSFDKIGDVQVAQGDLAAALKSYRDSLAIVDRLAAGDPGSTGRQRDRHVSFIKIGNVQVAQGDLSAALESYRDGLVIRERLAAGDPGNAGRQRDLAVSFSKIGDIQVAQSDLSAALESYRGSLAIVERLAASDPGNAGSQRDLSIAFNRVGDVQVAQGDLSAALESHRSGLAIAERLAAADPGNGEWQRDLSVSFNNIGDIQVAQGDLAAALESYRNGLAIVESLAAGDPGNAGWQRDVSFSLNRIGDVQVAQGDLSAALESHRSGLAIAERLAAGNPGNAGWQRDLYFSFNRIGDVQVAQGDLAAALKSYRDGNAIIERLAAGNPGNAGWQRDVSVSFSKIGDVQVAQGDLPAALESHRSGLATAERLAAGNPGNAGWQRDLSVSLNKVGNVQVAQGDLAAALDSYRASLAIRERLAASDPGNARWQRDLITAHYNIAKAGGHAEEHLSKALDIALAMQAKGILAPADAGIPDMLRKELAELEVAAK